MVVNGGDWPIAASQPRRGKELSVRIPPKLMHQHTKAARSVPESLGHLGTAIAVHLPGIARTAATTSPATNRASARNAESPGERPDETPTDDEDARIVRGHPAGHRAWVDLRRQQDARDCRPMKGHCANCGYDLTGNESGTCSECGVAA